MTFCEAPPLFTTLQRERRALRNFGRPEPVGILNRRQETVLQRVADPLAKRADVVPGDQIQPLVALPEHLNHLLFEAPQIALKVTDYIAEDAPLLGVAAGQHGERFAGSDTV